MLVQAVKPWAQLLRLAVLPMLALNCAPAAPPPAWPPAGPQPLLPAAARRLQGQGTSAAGISAVRGLIGRVAAPRLNEGLTLAVDPTLCTGPTTAAAPSSTNGCFVLRNSGAADGGAATVSIAGSSAIELAAGVGHYLRTVCNASFSWPGTGITARGRCTGKLFARRSHTILN